MIALSLTVLLGAAPETLLVMGWSVGPGVELPHAVLDQLLEDAVAREARELRVVSLRDIGAVLDLEQAKDLIGCDDVSCTAEVGLALDADRIVTAAIGRLGGRYHLVLKTIDARTARVVSRVNAAARRESVVPRLVARAARALLTERATSVQLPVRSHAFTREHEVQRGRVTQRWVTIEPEPQVPFVVRR